MFYGVKTRVSCFLTKHKLCNIRSHLRCGIYVNVVILERIPKNFFGLFLEDL